MAYTLPTNTDYQSCSWQCHKNRNPPSTEPGTDYASAYGSPLYAPEAGTVFETKTSTSSATGRFLAINLDDGRRTRSLHLAEIWVSPGQRVSRGQQIGLTGASGYGSDWGYGAHVHQSLWPGWYYEFCATCTIDFALYVGASGPIAGNQRAVGSNPANGRSDPSTANPATQQLPPGTVADFNGWITGENVSGNAVWFRGMHSGDWFWSGGFTDTGTHDLTDLNPPAITGTQRIVGMNGVNGRAEPASSATLHQSLPAATVADMNGWTQGEAVEGNDTWFRGQHSGDWFWSGGFEDTGTHDLAEVSTDPEPPDPPATSDNPRGLVEYPPVYPRAVKGLEAPLGFTDCHSPVTRSPRSKKGSPPVDTAPLIDRFVFHWTGVTGDQLDYFSYCNDRSSCPTTFTRPDGSTFELIRPGAKPAATGPDWNYRTWAVEMQMGPDPAKPITDQQLEEGAQQVAFLASFDGGELDGCPVSFTIDRVHVIGHRDTTGTECPGDYLYGMLDAIIERAKEIAGEVPTDPCAGCPCEECPECPEVPAGSVVVDRDFLVSLQLTLDAASADITGMLG